MLWKKKNIQKQQWYTLNAHTLHLICQWTLAKIKSNQQNKATKINILSHCLEVYIYIYLCMYIYMYSLLLGRVSVNSFGRLTQWSFSYWQKLSTQKAEELYRRTTLFYKDCPHKTTLGPSVMSKIMWLCAAQTE